MAEQERTMGTYQASMKLRILVKKVYGVEVETLQQAWVCLEDHSIEWRDVEIVHEEQGNGN